MSGSVDPILLLNDFVSLPIIITDYDALTAEESVPSYSNSRDTSPCSASSTTPARRRWSTGFSNFIDALWNRMTSGMRQKLRAACVEVLHRTDDIRKEKMCWQYDEDARLLD